MPLLNIKVITDLKKALTLLIQRNVAKREHGSWICKISLCSFQYEYIKMRLLEAIQKRTLSSRP